jgi:hypothetical protein
MQPFERIVYKDQPATYLRRWSASLHLIRLDHAEQREIDTLLGVDSREILVPSYKYSRMKGISMSIKTIVTDAVAALTRAVKGDSPKEAAIRRLGIANELASQGEAIKKKTKTELKQLGLILDEYVPGALVAFDSDRIRMTANTRQPSQRLDQDELRKALAAEGVSTAKINRAIAAATVDSKAATSFTVELK